MTLDEALRKFMSGNDSPTAGQDQCHAQTLHRRCQLSSHHAGAHSYQDATARLRWADDPLTQSDVDWTAEGFDDTSAKPK